MKKIKKIKCSKCREVLRCYWLKDGICHACRDLHLIVTALVKKQAATSDKG